MKNGVPLPEAPPSLLPTVEKIEGTLEGDSLTGGL